MSSGIRADGVGKVIRGRTILEGVDVAVEPGEVLGFIGPNGAGKSTLIRILAGLSRPTGGSVRVNGAPVDGVGRLPTGLGLVPEQAGFVEHLSGLRNLLMLARLRGVASAKDVRRAIGEVGLDPSDRRPTGKYSLGMRQRLSIAQAIMERPQVLILDEPTNGLDVMGIQQLRSLIRSEADRGTAVFLASHLLGEVELACDRVLVVKEGRILRELSTSALRRDAHGIRLVVSTPEDWRTVRARIPEAIRAEDDGGRLPEGILPIDAPVPRVVRDLVAVGVSIEEIGPQRMSLEQAFLEQVLGETQ